MDNDIMDPVTISSIITSVGKMADIALSIVKTKNDDKKIEQLKEEIKNLLTELDVQVSTNNNKINEQNNIINNMRKEYENVTGMAKSGYKNSKIALVIAIIAIILALVMPWLVR